MGGPASYTSEHLERVHAHLNITEEAFKESLSLGIGLILLHYLTDRD
jgi:hypothetical protein